MHRAGGDDDRLRAHRQCNVADSCVNAGRRAAIDHNTAHVAIHHNARAPRGRILKIGDQGRLLRACAASHAAVAARIVLRAAAHVARQQPVMPSQLLEAPDEHLVAPRGPSMIGVDTEPARDGVERARVFRALEVRQVVRSSPLPAHGFGCRKARRVVDHGTATERRALQDDQTEIARGQQAARVVHRLERVAFLVREVRLVTIAAFLQHDDVLPGGGQLGRDDATTGAGADHDDIATERGVPRDGEGTDRLRCGGWRA